MTDPLVAVLATALSEAQRQYRAANRLGALCTPTIPAPVIDRFAEAVVPVMRALVHEAIAEITATTAESGGTPQPLSLAG
jgi:hypothetical protein